MFETVNPSKAWASFVPALSRQGWHRNEMQNNLLPQHCATGLTFESYYHSVTVIWQMAFLGTESQNLFYLCSAISFC